MTDEDRCDVIVVGGSLVGSSAAMFLAQQGLNVALVERRATVSPHPRARGISVRTMELFRSAGIESDVRAAGEDDFTFAIGDTLAGDHAIAPRDLEAMGRLSPTTPYSCDQNRIEPILRRRAHQGGATIWTGCHAGGLSQSSSEVTVQLSPAHAKNEWPDQPPRRITARYLIAADGANSALRRELGIGQHGHSIPGIGLSALFDADLSSALRGRRVSALVSPARGALLFPRGIVREHHWFGMTPRAGLEQLEGHALEALARSAIQALVGDLSLPVTLSSVLTWTTGAHVADQYRCGQVFFAGDAAHLMPPYGGFGGNTGIADAHNLAWKMAAVCTGDASEELLDTYERERQPIAEFTVQHVTARGFAMQTTPPDPSYPRLSPAEISIGYCYPTNQQGEPTWPVRDPNTTNGAPGMRVPHIPLHGMPTSTVDLVDPTSFTFLTPEDGLLASAMRVNAVPGVQLRTVSRHHVADTATFRRVFTDPSVGLLVRPDGIVGWRTSGPLTDPPAAVADAHRRCLVDE